MEINSEKVKEILSKGEMALMGLLGDVVDGRVSRECEQVFEDAIELGIENTMRALIEAEVDDDGTVSALHEVWGLPRKEAVERAVWLKKKIAVEYLKELLLLKGMRSEAIDSFCRDYAIQVRLGRENGLLEL